MTEQDNGFKWKNRRRMAWLTFGISFAILVYLTAVGGDSSTHDAIIGAIAIILPGVIGSYIFGATWGDKP